MTHIAYVGRGQAVHFGPKLALHHHHTNPVLLFRPCSTVQRPHGCKCCALLLFVRKRCSRRFRGWASVRRPRLARPSDGGKNASADNQRTVAPELHGTQWRKRPVLGTLDCRREMAAVLPVTQTRTVVHQLPHELCHLCGGEILLPLRPA